ncbi:sensor histidine kinase [Paenibacillus sp. PAMC21692]|uniref:sensor histidine kinase n=1 Tax=Paenibacillus sp. PAMC21692 TaxID=2762320 RepID=UPI00164E242A|nr:sensor histidine kinase [Paenibacillus sp. PAMC21692]QNK57197.1 sensor histidine kinase [Paenibacillus sp. PAMC21692]
MRKLSRLKYRNWPIFYKMAIVFSLLSTSLILSTGFLSYVIYRNSLENQIGEFVPQVLSQVNHQVENYLDDLKSTWPDNLEQALKEINLKEGLPSLEKTLMIRDIIDTLKLQLKGSLYGVTFYTDQGYAYVNEQSGGVWKNVSYVNQPWYSQLDLVDFSPIVLGTVHQQIVNNSNGTFFFSIVQPLRLTGTKNLAGVMQIFGTMEPLNTIMNGIDLGPDSRFYILDNDNKIVYSTFSSQFGKYWSPTFGFDISKQVPGAHSDTVMLNNKKYMLSYNWSSGTNWKVIGFVPMDNFSKGISRIALWTGIWGVIGVVIAILLSSLLAYGFTQRLKQLSKQIRSTQLDELEQKQEALQYDEIGYLSVSFRSMINRIRNLVDEVLKSKILKQEAEIKALHSQINPHFLYNVLESIRMTVKKGEHAAAEAALVSLGQLYRYQTNQENDLVTIGKEMEFIEQYLHIQQFRFGDLLEAQVDVASDVHNFLFPRMILQPLIENVLKHGQSQFDMFIQLLVRIRCEQESILVDIADEGDGMSVVRLQEVLDGLEQGVTVDQRFGLANVYQRIKNLYGERGIMHIESEEGAGTIIQIRIPAEHYTKAAHI